SREKDQESDLFNNGVRKLDDNIGRFTSIDPLWEKFPSWSPYQYGYNNPLRVTDPGGMQGRTPITPQVEMGPDGLPSLYGGLHYPSNAIGKAVAGDQPMRTSERGRTFIKSYEALRLHVYNDQAGNATIGYGSKLGDKPYTEGTHPQTITEAEADALFDKDVKEDGEDHVNSAVSVSLTQNQFDALVSLTFNKYRRRCISELQCRPSIK
ncbi:MAG: glycoside hydrolase family protein, partial [Chlorobi bacterium]|nr:glycoside hydrolase family protein [Chlorobiota bacterium]